MEKIVDQIVNMEHRHVKETLVWCFDPRFTALRDAYLSANNLAAGDYDLVSVAGGAKDLAANSDYLLDQIAKSVKLHSPKNITLMAHYDCGAYGATLANLPEGEREIFLKEELAKARVNLNTYLASQGYAGVEISLIVAGADGIYRLE